MLCKVTSDDRELLMKLILPGGRCKCGEPAVVRYIGGKAADRLNASWSFDWPRCAFCPGVRHTQGQLVEARPMEPHHRDLLSMMGDEEAFMAAVRLGYRPPCYDSRGEEIDGEVQIDLYYWELDWRAH